MLLCRLGLAREAALKPGVGGTSGALDLEVSRLMLNGSHPGSREEKRHDVQVRCPSMSPESRDIPAAGPEGVGWLPGANSELLSACLRFLRM